jgi:alkylhydroperoxidase family enzyme
LSKQPATATKEFERVHSLDRSSITDPALLDVLERSDRYSAPKAEWYLILGHSPEVAVGYADFWNLTYRHGRIEHTTKELIRVAITTLLGCRFCSTQRSVEALEQGLEEEKIAACALPDFDHPDARVRSALRLSRALSLDSDGSASDWDDIYRELHANFDDAEVAELICFIANTIGSTTVARSLNLKVD